MKKIIVNEVICPHCESELQVKLMRTDKGDIEHKVSVTDTGRALEPEQKPDDKKENSDNDSGSVDKDFWGE